MNLRWAYCYEKANDALERMISPIESAKDNIAEAYRQHMLHVSADQIPDECVEKYEKYVALINKYGKYDSLLGLNFYGTRTNSLAKITTAFLEFYQEFMRVYYTDGGYRA